MSDFGEWDMKQEVFLQWKNTDVCMDLHCPSCGHHNHYGDARCALPEFHKRGCDCQSAGRIGNFGVAGTTKCKTCGLDIGVGYPQCNDARHTRSCVAGTEDV